MTRLPRETLAIIESERGEWSNHALDDAERLGLHGQDVVAVARSSCSWKRSRDRRRSRTYVDAIIGHDTHGRAICMAARETSYAGRPLWYVIAIHEAI